MRRWYRCSWCDELDMGVHTCGPNACERCGAQWTATEHVRGRVFCPACAEVVRDTITTNQMYSEQVLRMKGLL